MKVSTFWSDTGVRPGGQISLAVVLDIREHYHVNSATAKEFPTTVELSNSLGDLRYSTPIFPSPHEIEFGVGDAKQNIEVFSERAIIYVPMAVTDSAKAGEKEIHVKVTYQACDDRKCLLPADFTQTTKLVVVEKTAQIEKINEELFKGLKERKERLNVSFFGWDFKFMPSKLWILLMVAAVGGFLLNLTPCVLPLIPVKIMGLSRAAGNRQRCFLLGVAMSLGVVTFWLALAIGVSSIRGFATNKLFQYPIFTITIGVIICIMAAGMCGFFITRLPQWTYRINPSQESGMGSFLFGIMTAVLSTPCTAPFMGAAAAWSVTQGPAITLGTFAAIGIGMALPYLILSACPILVNRMPRTGPASDLIKQVMGLLMVAAGAYFLGTGVAGLLANPPDPPTQAYWWIVAFFIAAAGFWLMWRTVQITTRTGNRVGFGIVGTLLIVAAVGLGFRFTRGSPIKWIYYTRNGWQKLRNSRKLSCWTLRPPGVSTVMSWNRLCCTIHKW